MWRPGDLGNGARGGLTLRQVLDELVEDNEKYLDAGHGFEADSEDEPETRFSSAPAADFVDRCRERFYVHVRLGPSESADRFVLAVLAGRGWVRRPPHVEQRSPDTVHDVVFDAQQLILFAGEMAFRTCPGEHAFFDQASDPMAVKSAALDTEYAWVWSTLADIYGCPGLDGRLLKDTAWFWQGSWDELLDHVGRLLC
jgi:hypothetical protein